jgi:hypothetical protein
MATKVLVCPECGSEVGPGRFACTTCGAMLAAVASAPRPFGGIDSVAVPIVRPATPVRDDALPVDAVIETPAATAGRATIGPAWAHGPRERAPGETDLDLVDEDAPLSAEAEAARETELLVAEAEPDAAATEPEADPRATAEAEPEATDANKAEHEATAEAEPAEPEAIDVAAAEPPSTEEAQPESTEPEATDVAADAAAEAVTDAAAPELVSMATAQGGEPSWPETRTWPPPGAGRPQPYLEPAKRPRAGAYLPPSALLTTVDERPAASMSGVPAGQASPAAQPPARTTDDGARATAKLESRLFPVLDANVPPRVIVMGAGISGLGFLLPWAAIVIGSGRIGGYFEQWGIAGPGHPVILLVVVALGAASSQIDRLPHWARPALPAVILGGLLIGLVWPYLFGSLQSSVGVYLTLVGAILLSVGGLLDLWVGRHAGQPPVV